MGFDKKIYDFGFSSEIIKEKNSISFSIYLFEIKNKNVKTTDKKIKIEGFMEEDNYLEKLNSLLSSIDLKYPNLESFSVVDFDFSKIIFENLNKYYEVSFEKTKIENNSFILDFYLVYKPNKKIKSAVKSYILKKNLNDQSLIDYKAQNVLVTIPKDKLLNDLKITDFTFANYDEAKYIILDTKLEKMDKKAIISFSLKSKKDNFKSTVIKKEFTKFRDFYENEINEIAKSIDIKGKNINLDIFEADDLFADNLSNDYELEILNIEKGLFSILVNYKIILKNTDLKSDVKRKIITDVVVNDDFKNGELNGVVIEKCMFLLPIFNFEKYHFASQAASKIMPNYSYKTLDINTQILEFNDALGTIQLELSLTKNPNLKETITIFNLKGISNENSDELSIDFQSLTSIKLKDENYLLEHFIKHKDFFANNQQEGEKFKDIIIFPSSATLRNNTPITFLDFSLDFEITKVKLGQNNIASFNYLISKKLKLYKCNEGEKEIEKRFLLTRVNKDNALYISKSKILTNIANSIEFDESFLQNYPSWLKRRHIVGKELPNIFIKYDDAKTQHDLDKYFDDNHNIIYEIESIVANDISGSIFMQYYFSLTRKDGTILVKSETVSKQVDGFKKIDKQILDFFSLEIGRSMLIEDNQQKTFKNIVDKYKLEGTLDEKTYSKDFIKNKNIIKNKEFTFWNNTDQIYSINPFEDSDFKDKVIFCFNTKNIIFDPQHGIRLNNSIFLPYKIKLSLDSVSIKQTLDSNTSNQQYEIKLNYKLVVTVFSGNDFHDDGTHILETLLSLNFNIPVVLFS